MEIPSEHVRSVMPQRDAIIANFNFVIQFLDTFLQNHWPPSGIFGDVLDKAKNLAAELKSIRSEVSAFKLPELSNVRDVFNRVLEFLEKEPGMEFYRTGYSGTYFDEGKSSQPAPASPENEKEIYIKAAATKLREIVNAIMEICHIVDETKMQVWKTLGDGIALPPEPTLAQQPTKAQKNIYRMLDIYERCFDGLTGVRKYILRIEQNSRDIDPSSVRGELILNGILGLLKQLTQLKKPEATKAVVDNVLSELKIALQDLKLYCYALSQYPGWGDLNLSPLDDYYRAAELMSKLATGELTPTMQIELHSAMPNLSYLPRAEKDVTSLYHDDRGRFFDIVNNIHAGAVLPANPHWKGVGSADQYKNTTPQLRSLASYEI